MTGNRRRASRDRRRQFHGVAISLFLASLWLPSLAMVWTRVTPGGRDRSPELGQEIAPLPHLPRTPAELEAFPAAFDASYEDRFGFRQELVRLHGMVMVMGLGVSPDDRVVIGKEGWLFLGAWPIPEADSVIQQVRGIRLLSPEELESWERGLEERRSWLARQGSRYVMVIVPHKHSIYPEFLPKRVNRVRNRTPLDQLAGHLTGVTDVEVLDLRPPLNSAKGEERIYRSLDTHWNILGARVGYEEILNSMSPWFPDLHPLPRSAFDEDTVPGSPGDLARTVGLGDVLQEHVPVLLPTRVSLLAQEVDGDAVLDSVNVAPSRIRVYETPLSHLPTAVVLHDSFTYTLIPLLSEHFSRIVYLRRPTTRDFLEDGDRSRPYLERLVEVEQPDVVIDQLVERNLVWAYRDYDHGPGDGEAGAEADQ